MHIGILSRNRNLYSTRRLVEAAEGNPRDEDEEQKRRRQQNAPVASRWWVVVRGYILAIVVPILSV